MFGPKHLLARKDSVLKLILYTGPALLVSMAYMDPGNYGTDIQGGASLNYSLLWVVWLSSGMAMLLQYLSGKIGIATGLSLPEVIREKLKKKMYIIPYWLAAEAAAAATDLAEYLGTVIALNFAIWNTNDLCCYIWSSGCNYNFDTGHRRPVLHY
jgi:manganese transport protein